MVYNLVRKLVGFEIGISIVRVLLVTRLFVLNNGLEN